MRGYVNEMQLLKRLDGNERIIKLIDSQAVGRGGRYLMMVMELGEIDLAKLLAEKQGTRLQPHWIAIYWQQVRQFRPFSTRTNENLFYCVILYWCLIR
jgi:serine/threonine-protein kinase TTK/MPS1